MPKLRNSSKGESKVETCALSIVSPAFYRIILIVNDVCDRYPDVEVLKKGVRVLMDRQFDNGDFPVVSLHSLSQSRMAFI